jgi:hypothetical protein
MRAVHSQPPIERITLEQVRDDEALAVLDADVEHREDAAMTELGQVACFTQERVGVALIDLDERHLDRHFALEERVVAGVDGGVPSLPAQASPLVPPEGPRLVGRDRLHGDRVGGRQLARRDGCLRERIGVDVRSVAVAHAIRRLPPRSRRQHHSATRLLCRSH